VPTEVDTLLRHQQLLGYVHDELAAYSGGVEGNAGLFGSAVDLVKVLQMLLNGGVYGGDRYITEETCRLFTGTRSAHSRRGLGFDKPAIDRPELGPTAPECPASVYGHTGFTGTCFWVDPENNMIYIFLCNRIHPSRDNTLLLQGNYRTRIQSLLYSAMK
jgi:CubicO group peptidase (beta-lactamase class C family)